MEDYYKQANTEEKNIFQQYLNKYVFYFMELTTLTLTAASLAGSLVVSLIRSRMFPLK